MFALVVAGAFSFAIAGNPTLDHRQRLCKVQSARRAQPGRAWPNVKMNDVDPPAAVGSFDDVRDAVQRDGHLVIPDASSAGAHEVAADSFSYACKFTDAAMCAAKSTTDAAVIAADSARETATIAADAARDAATIAADAARGAATIAADAATIAADATSLAAAKATTDAAVIAADAARGTATIAADATTDAAVIGAMAVLGTVVLMSAGEDIIRGWQYDKGKRETVKVLTPPPWAEFGAQPTSLYEQYWLRDEGAVDKAVAEQAAAEEVPRDEGAVDEAVAEEEAVVADDALVFAERAELSSAELLKEVNQTASYKNLTEPEGHTAKLGEEEEEGVDSG